MALLAAAKAARGVASSVWQLTEALCFKKVQGNEKNAKMQWGAHIAVQVLVETANLANISERNRPKITRVKTWLVHNLADNDFPARERALAGVTLAHLSDPRGAVMKLDAMPFCLIPAGPFWMGSEEYDDEKPQHLNETFVHDYWLAQFPVSNAQFDRFVQAGGYAAAKYWPEAGDAKVWQHGKVKGRWDDKPRNRPHDFGAPYHLPNHPLVGVTWYEALAFTRWLTESWHTESRLDEKWHVALPSEAEWEKAVRGGSFYYHGRDVRCPVRDWRNPNLRYDYVGFRVVLLTFFRAQKCPAFCTNGFTSPSRQVAVNSQDFDRKQSRAV